ncbi:hypothetical protein UA08_05344 [Talaromyces atroroseus]|uniref:RING-type E3 ubiquitin transferase n=1 Tax=Talaromyces atroroseus TaxID=1441469 RepID=A0A225B0S8_TALAT|nr:hypothetical protein UA08_05344 [Talaromyces atroroseus]OKL59397.1 hypothetical protein UA08_05344 [Talaromyces atroroseus]
MTTVTTLFAGPGTLQCGPRYGNQSIIFHYVIDGTIRTLSSTNQPAQESYKGQLFVPRLETDDVCTNITAPFVPSNTTRRNDFPPFDHHHHNNNIGLAPWITPECAQAYLAASRRDDARALIFYEPQSKDSGKPPPSDNALWDLGDGGQWKKDNQYPVYAVPGPAGSHLMHQLSQYSGRLGWDNRDGYNRSNGTLTTEAQVQENCTRLYALLDLEPEQSSSVPGVWVFVLAILGAIVLMMAFAFFTMQHVKKRRREGLQRRVVAGEVDLEYLGIKRLVVPPQLLCQLPVYVYPDEHDSKGDGGKERETDKKPQQDESESENENESISAILEEIMPKLQPPPRAAAAYQKGNQHRLTFSQRTCAICLDDFVPGTSLVRELPCTHIFHPECVDVFLMRDGSTCPVCKHNVLPPSFVEYQVRNLMAQHSQQYHTTSSSRSHSHYHHRSPMHETQLPDLPFPVPSARRIMSRLGAWMRLTSSSNDEARISTTAAPEQGEDAVQQHESYDPVRREMMQRRAMVLLGRPVGDHPGE